MIQGIIKAEHLIDKGKRNLFQSGNT